MAKKGEDVEEVVEEEEGREEEVVLRRSTRMRQPTKKAREMDDYISE